MKATARRASSIPAPISPRCSKARTTFNAFISKVAGRMDTNELFPRTAYATDVSSVSPSLMSCCKVRRAIVSPLKRTRPSTRSLIFCSDPCCIRFMPGRFSSCFARSWR